MTNVHEGNNFVNANRTLTTLQEYLWNAIPELTDETSIQRVISAYQSIPGIGDVHSQAAAAIGDGQSTRVFYCTFDSGFQY